MLQPASCCWAQRTERTTTCRLELCRDIFNQKDCFCCGFKHWQAAESAPPIAGMWDWQPGQTCKYWYETRCPEWAGLWPVYPCPDTSRAVPALTPAQTILELTSVKLPTMTGQMATMKGRGACFHIRDLSVTFAAWWQTHGSRAWTFWDLYDVFWTLGHVWWFTGCQLQPHHSQMTQPPASGLTGGSLEPLVSEVKT